MPAVTTVVIFGLTIQTLYVVAFVASVALSYVLSSLNKPDGLRGSNQTDPGVRAQIPPDTTTPMPVVYGDAYIGGRFVDACIREDQKVMYYVQAISCISENGQFSFDTTKFYYGDRLITFDNTTPNRVASLTDGSGNVDTTINGYLYISLYTSDSAGNITAINTGGKLPWEYLTVPDGDGTSVLMGTGSGLLTELQWTSTGRRMNGLAFAVVRLSYSRDAGTTQLQALTYHVSHYLNNADVAKPGDVWFDYMTNSVYGAAVSSDYVDATSRTALNNYSDEVITFNDYNGNPQTQPRYRINGVVDANKSVLKNIDDIMQACDSWLRYEASTGLWSVTINKAGEPALALNDNNIIGSIVCGTTDLAQGVNVVEGKFPDSANRDQYNYVNLAVPFDLLYPNEPVSKQTLTYELVNNSVQALYLANRVLEQGREDLTVTVNTTYVGIQLSAGDIVSITNTQYGWNAKLFRCFQVQESFVDGSLGAQLQLIEYNAQVYDNFDITQFTPAPNTDLPSGYFFSSLSAPSVINPEPSAVIPVFDVQCATPVTGRVTNINLYYTTVAAPEAADWLLWGTQSLPNSQPYNPSVNVIFDNLSLKPATYYFAYKVANEIASSALSPMSTAFVWNPTADTAGTFVATFQPSTIQIPYINNVAQFSGISWRLYGTTNQGEVDFSIAQSDSDPLFVNNSWRIGYNSTGGWAEIVSTNITIPTLTDGGTYAQWGAPTAMTADTATIAVPIRYKDPSGNVVLIPVAFLQFAYAKQGDTGSKNSIAYLYQWNTSVPGDPSGTSTFNWSTLTNSSYTGGNGWSTAIPANSGVPLLKLYQASKGVTATSSATTSTVDWTSGFRVADVTANGAAGTQVATPTVYQWAITIPAGPTGTSTYTWSTGAFTAPSGWSLTPGTAPSAGFTLWGATVQLITTATSTTSTINWTTASISARGYAGDNGSTGTTGASARICYSKTTLSSLASTPTTITTSGSSSFPPNASWGSDTVWQATPPTIVAGESVYQSDGIYSPTSGNTIWNVPYLSNLKVGSLSAISANMGSLTSGTITGALIRTAATGKRLEMDYASNSFKGYASTGGITVEIGGSSGSVYATTTTSGLVPIVGGGSTYASGVSGVSTSSYGVIGQSTSGSGVYGGSSSAPGVSGTSTSGIGVYGYGNASTSTNHGVRGTNGSWGSSGLVGMAGSFDFYAEGSQTNYGPFTGAHDCIIATNQFAEIGAILSDEFCACKKNVSNTIFAVQQSSSANQIPIGVFVVDNGLLNGFRPAAFVESMTFDGNGNPVYVMYPEYDTYKNEYDYCVMNAVGEGQVLVCGENGNINAGDLIVTSSVAGVGMKQADDIVRNYTVAKARENVTFTDTTTPVLVACIYLCG